MIDHNVTTIAAALRGEAADRGMSEMPIDGRGDPQPCDPRRNGRPWRPLCSPRPLSRCGASTVSYGQTPRCFPWTRPFPAGRLSAIVGPNGAGKSTFLKAALGHHSRRSGEAPRPWPPAGGTRRDRIAYVPQRASVDWDFPTSRARRGCDGASIAAVGLPAAGSAGRTGRTARDCSPSVGMADFADRQIGQLSGGQQQRVFLPAPWRRPADLYSAGRALRRGRRRHRTARSSTVLKAAATAEGRARRRPCTMTSHRCKPIRPCLPDQRAPASPKARGHASTPERLKQTLWRASWPRGMSPNSPGGSRDNPCSNALSAAGGLATRPFVAIGAALSGVRRWAGWHVPLPAKTRAGVGWHGPCHPARRRLP